MADHRDEVVRLKKEEGLGDTEIGRRLGISKQRVAQILKPKPRVKPISAPKGMLNVSDVSQLLGIHVNTVRRWTNQGRLKAYRICSRGDRRYQRDDIEAFLMANHREGIGVARLCSGPYLLSNQNQL